MQAKLTYSSSSDPIVKKLAIRTIERLTGRPILERKYNEILNLDPKPSELWALMLKELDLTLAYDQQKITQIAKDQPLVFIANHPFGVVDGVIFGYLVNQVKPQFKFLVNEVLCKEERLNRFFLPVDFAETKEAQKTNISTRKEAIKRLEANEPIVIFPSGGVATAPTFWKKAEELEWKRFVIKLIKNAKATVVPLFFHGQNSRLFQVVSQFSMDLRLALLLNEVRNKMGSTIKIDIGDPISYGELKQYEKDEMLIFLKNKVESLPLHQTNRSTL